MILNYAISSMVFSQMLFPNSTSRKVWLFTEWYEFRFHYEPFQLLYREFTDKLKHVNARPVHKKNEKCDKKNYRPVGILTNISKIHEKLWYNQSSKYFDSVLVTNQCGFRKGFTSEYCLLVMLEKFEEAIERGNQFGALLTDLSKAFDRIDHKVLIEKLMRRFIDCPKYNIFLPET